MGLLIAWLARRSVGRLSIFDCSWPLVFWVGSPHFRRFHLDAVTLYERGALTAAAGYVIASVAVSILALIAGLWLARQL